MSERLSRMDRHPSTRKKRRKRQTFKQEWQDNQMKLSDTTVMRLSVPENRVSSPERPKVKAADSSAFVSRAETVSAYEEPAGAKSGAEEEEELPPRSVLYPSSRLRLHKWFYETLIVLFLILLGTLLWWGTQATGVKWPWQ
ncbi:hypothetical protein [Saccharibacillus kuerlensis]|uniref:Uncharacterized protein n=1 Tax=Saccharibacillus kuerlensis TaxID=459527 RepID=A0ABQ2KWU5_9BACL|nr:hypothetical protein [Saccharibacillus kuerlensis]GGN95305.1 hypothetical protein GCM10010969_10910 [Saccharibacillus kuerlensis]